MRLSILPLILLPFISQTDGLDSNRERLGSTTDPRDHVSAQDLETIRANVRQMNERLMAQTSGAATSQISQQTGGSTVQRDPEVRQRLKTNVTPPEGVSTQKVFVNGSYHNFEVGPTLEVSGADRPDVRMMDSLEGNPFAEDYERSVVEQEWASDEGYSEGDTDMDSYFEYQDNHRGE